MKKLATIECLTQWDVATLHKQVRKNSRYIDRLIEKIDLLANKEKCPKDANTLLYLRKKLKIAMAENDTFRKVLCRHALSEEEQAEPWLDPVAFLVGRIRERERSQLAEAGRTSKE